MEGTEGTKQLSPRSRPFLTVEQREALDAALAEKQGGLRFESIFFIFAALDAEKATSEGRRWMVHRRSHSKEFYEKMERKSKSGKGPGTTKKGGAGGKYTWGSYLEDTVGVAVLDKSDPNYDSDSEVTKISYRAGSKLIQEVEEYKEKVKLLLDAV